VKIEGLYVDLEGSERYRTSATAVAYARDNVGFTYFAPVGAISPGPSSRSDESFAVVRAGLNYRFTTN
jgi:hypothetical protein